MAIELRGEKSFAEADPLLLAHPVEACTPPDLLGRLDDEGRGLAVELVDVGLEPAVLGFFERERERVETLVRPEPDEAAPPNVDLWTEDIADSGRERRC